MIPCLAALLVLAVPSPAVQTAAGDRCTKLTQLVKSTYDFVPANLPGAARPAKFAAMDEVWNLAKSAPQTFAPCLRALLTAADAQPWFLCDGSALLAEIEPTKESLELEARLWSATSIDIIDLEPWTWTLAKLGSQGLDVSAGGETWLRSREKQFTVAKHALTVGTEAAGIFVFGSMDEAQATPVLTRIAADAAHPGRADALMLLGLQATPEALDALRKLDLSGFAAKDREKAAVVLKKPAALKTRSGGPKRDEILDAMKALVAGKPDALGKLEAHDEDWFAHLASVLKPEDVPLVRQVRRKRLLVMSDEALGDYLEYSNYLWAKVWKPAGK